MRKPVHQRPVPPLQCLPRARPERSPFCRTMASSLASNAKLFVGGLKWETQPAGVHTYFSQFGKVIDVMVPKDRASGRSRGFAFVTMSSSADAKAILDRQHALEGRELNLHSATPEDGTKHTTAGGTVASSNRLYVGELLTSNTGGQTGWLNPVLRRLPLPPTDTPARSSARPTGLPTRPSAHSPAEDELREAFGRFGEFQDVVIMRNPATLESRGFGFVSFSSAEEADQAMQAMHGTMIGGKRLRIEKATAKQEMGIKEKPYEP